MTVRVCFLRKLVRSISLMISQISLQLTEWEDDLVLLSEPNLQQLSTAVDGGLESQTIKGLLPNYDEITER